MQINIVYIKKKKKVIHKFNNLITKILLMNSVAT